MPFRGTGQGFNSRQASSTVSQPRTSTLLAGATTILEVLRVVGLPRVSLTVQRTAGNGGTCNLQAQSQAEWHTIATIALDGTPQYVERYVGARNLRVAIVETTGLGPIVVDTLVAAGM